MAGRNMILFYDKDCGFCQATIEWLVKNLKSKLITIPYQDKESINKYPQLDLSLSNKEVQLIQDQRIYSGAEAIARCLKLKSNCFYNLIGNFILLPIILSISRLFYALVAKNRSKISKLLGLTSCKLK